MFGLSDAVNMLSSTPDTALHLHIYPYSNMYSYGIIINPLWVKMYNGVFLRVLRSVKLLYPKGYTFYTFCSESTWSKVCVN